jgi:hypothetical protein
MHYRLAVNVMSQLAPSELLYLVDDDFHHPVTAVLAGLPSGGISLPGDHAVVGKRRRHHGAIVIVPRPDQSVVQRAHRVLAHAAKSCTGQHLTCTRRACQDRQGRAPTGRQSVK